MTILARDLPKLIALPAPPCICRNRNIPTPISAMNSGQETSGEMNQGTLSAGGFAVICAFASYRRFTRLGSSGA
jgi:hypothetical protein